MLAGAGGGDDLLRVLLVVAADGNGVDFRVGKQGGEVAIHLEWAAVFGGEFAGFEWPGRTDGGHLGPGAGIDRRDVRLCRPAVTDNTDVVFLHSIPPVGRQPGNRLHRAC